MPEIVQLRNDTDGVLRKVAQEIPPTDITDDSIQRILQDMSEALASQDDGVALAAPQIGISKRIFIVSEKVFDMDEQKETSECARHLVFINPELVALSKDKEALDEGCLSIRYKYGKVLRSSKAKVRAYDEDGKKFERGASGLLAQIFQHETDHLNGTLFIDKAEDIVEISPEEWEKQKDQSADNDV